MAQCGVEGCAEESVAKLYGEGERCEDCLAYDLGLRVATDGGVDEGSGQGVGQFSVRDGTPFQSDRDKLRLAEHVAGLLPEDKIVVYGNAKERTLTVEQQLDPVEDLRDWPIDWSAKRLSEGEVGYVLSGYGTEYMLSANLERPELLPCLSWPSNRGVAVLGVEVSDRESEIRAEKAAGDLYWRVQRYDGR